jgi:hypothetical protein
VTTSIYLTVTSTERSVRCVDSFHGSIALEGVRRHARLMSFADMFLSLHPSISYVSSLSMERRIRICFFAGFWLASQQRLNAHLNLHGHNFDHDFYHDLCHAHRKSSPDQYNLFHVGLLPTEDGRILQAQEPPKSRCFRLTPELITHADATTGQPRPYR